MYPRSLEGCQKLAAEFPYLVVCDDWEVFVCESSRYISCRGYFDVDRDFGKIGIVKKCKTLEEAKQILSSLKPNWFDDLLERFGPKAKNLSHENLL